MEVMCQVIEDEAVTISRAQGSLTVRANFMLMVALKPSPLGLNYLILGGKVD
jgi:predicted ATPase with chaperone activity